MSFDDTTALAEPEISLLDTAGVLGSRKRLIGAAAVVAPRWLPWWFSLCPRLSRPRR